MAETSAVMNHLGGEETIKRSRKDEVMSDAACLVLTTKSGTVSGKFLIIY